MRFFGRTGLLASAQPSKGCKKTPRRATLADMEQTHAQPSTSAPSPDNVIGTWRRFGLVGPVYEVIGQDHKLENGDWLMRIRVLESGEETAYKLTDILGDPAER